MFASVAHGAPCSNPAQGGAAVGAGVGHGVASVVPSVLMVGSQPRTKLNVAAAVVAMVPLASSSRVRPTPFGLPEKKFAGTIATAPPLVGFAENTACVV